MEIIRAKDHGISFSNIELGDCFSPVGSNLIYMRTTLGMNYTQDEDVNAVELKDGTFGYFAPDHRVNKIKCQLIVE